MKMLNVRATDILVGKLDEIAEHSGHTRSEVIRYALDRFADENQMIKVDSFRQVFLKNAVAKGG